MITYLGSGRRKALLRRQWRQAPDWCAPKRSASRAIRSGVHGEKPPSTVRHSERGDFFEVLTHQPRTFFAYDFTTFSSRGKRSEGIVLKGTIFISRTLPAWTTFPRFEKRLDARVPTLILVFLPLYEPALDRSSVRGFFVPNGARPEIFPVIVDGAQPFFSKFSPFQDFGPGIAYTA